MLDCNVTPERPWPEGWAFQLRITPNPAADRIYKYDSALYHQTRTGVRVRIAEFGTDTQWGAKRQGKRKARKYAKGLAKPKPQTREHFFNV